MNTNTVNTHSDRPYCPFSHQSNHLHPSSITVESYFEVVADVNDTWARVKSSRDFRQEFGLSLFTRMFDFAPAVWKAFPWGHGFKAGDDLTTNPDFVVFARNFVGMLDLAIDMLGPDMDLVEEQLQHLGVSHIDYGVMPKHYPLMGRALMDTMAAKLGDRFTTRHKESWNTVYTFMSVSMMQGAFQHLTKSMEVGNGNLYAPHYIDYSAVNESKGRRTSLSSNGGSLAPSSSSLTVVEEGVTFMVSLSLGDNHEYSVLVSKESLFTNPTDLSTLVEDWEDVIASTMSKRLQRKLRRTTNMSRIEQVVGRLPLEAMVNGKQIPIDESKDLAFAILQLQQNGRRGSITSSGSGDVGGGLTTVNLVYDTDDLELAPEWNGRNFDLVHMDSVVDATGATDC